MAERSSAFHVDFSPPPTFPIGLGFGIGRDVKPNYFLIFMFVKSTYQRKCQLNSTIVSK